MSIQKCKPIYNDGTTIIKRAPFTQLYNKVLQTCTNMGATAVWAYLQSQTDDWELSPVQLRKHFKISKDKIYAILSYMIDAKLLVRHVQYGEMHKHIKTTYTVLDGTEYLDPATVISESVQATTPLPENREPENRDPDNQDYKKERDLEKKDDNKELNNSASDDARQRANDDAFENYWKINPIKKNRVRAKRIWDKKKLYKIETVICADILNRLENDSQWQNKQYIPHPSTYLGNELWNDEITTHESTTPTSKNRSVDALSRVLKKHMNRGATYDQHGNTYDPLR